MSGEMEFDQTVDVVAIGYGFAGACAAITAHDGGAKVLVLEKMPHGGGNSRVSAGQGFVALPGEDAIRDLVDWLDAMCLHTTPRDVLEAFARGTRELPPFLRSLGGEFSVPKQKMLTGRYPSAVKGPNFPQIATNRPMFDKCCLDGPDDVPPSRRLWELFAGAVSERNIEVRYESPATDLIRDEQGHVIGVAAVTDGRTIRIRARKGVVMSCGGFIANPEMRWDYAAPKPLKFAGNPGNTGDGIGMAIRAGADLWHMTRTSTFIGFQSPEHEAAFCIFFPGPGFIWVDKYGRRYIDETSVELHDFDRVFAHIDPDKVEFPRIPSWGIFDEEARMGGALTWPIAGYNREAYRWSDDNSVELEKGWIRRAETIEALAEITGIEVASLSRTLGRYNSACVEGKDEAFGRAGETLKKLEPPYYAIQLHPVALNTQGGAKRDAAARIIDTHGQPIPGLYSAGEFGSIWGHLYPGGGNITEAMVFGRIAGQSILARST